MPSPKLRSALRAFTDIFLPRSCIICGAASPHEEPFDICPACRPAIALPEGRYCPRCAAAMAPYAHACPNCHNMRLAMNGSTAFGLYSGPLRERIIEFKFAGQAHLARTLGHLCSEAALRSWPDVRFDAVTAVPLHSGRRRERGFDQGRRLAHYAARSLGTPFKPRIVRRLRRTESQVGHSKSARVRNMKGAFAASPLNTLETILVVDDIMTTGATASEVARALKRAGARRVFVAAVARAAQLGPLPSAAPRS